MSMRLLLVVLVCSACAEEGPTIATLYDRSDGLYSAPFPSDDLRLPGGRIDLSKFPNPHRVELIDQAIALLDRDNQGFALSGAIYFRTLAPVDPASLPSLQASVAPGASVFLIGVGGSDRGTRHPIDVAFLADGGPFGDANLLSLLPLQGLPLSPESRYAAVITRRMTDDQGRAFAPTGEITALVKGERPAGLSDAAHASYRDAVSALGELGVALDEIAGLTVFTTGAPAAQLRTVRDHALARPLPKPGAFTRSDVFTDYCVYNATITLPVYQSGKPPYEKSGGDWRFDGAGVPVLDHEETARVVVTVPRRVLPAAGFPTMMFVRTGGGGDRPLVDRGRGATEHFEGPIVPGSGPAQELAQAGFAGVQVDGPLGGARNLTMGDEQFLIFNVLNPSALRDNVRQSALELIVLARALEGVTFSSADCPGAPATTSFDPAHLAIMGHSMGGWIAPLVLSGESRYGAAVLSGAGGSYIANIMDKIKPLHVRPLAEILLDYNMDQRSLSRHDPALTLVQWAAEPSDPQVYATRGRHILMVQGIVDHYILPSIANSTSLSHGLDLAGPQLDTQNSELASLMQTPLSQLLPLAGRAAIALPAQGNQAGATAVVVQHASDGIQDGHEVIFQLDEPKAQYRCFLSTWVTGTPRVPASGMPCP
jgi:hypothetical protein